MLVRSLAAAAISLGVGSAAFAQDDFEPESVTLSGVIRDFPESHPDFEEVLHSQFRTWNDNTGGDKDVYKALVLPTLDEDGKPVLNDYYESHPTLMLGDDNSSEAEVSVGFKDASVSVASTKDLSNVVLLLSDGSHHKFDNLDVGPYAIFESPIEGLTIDGVWVKSGSYQSPDGPGYGRFFDRDQADMSRRIPISSSETFAQWYRDLPETNISIPLQITLKNSEDKPDVFTFKKEAPDYFFPIDDQGFGISGYGADREHHNFHFTFEVRTKFTYIDPAERDYTMTFKFIGDDDVWVFINGKLAVDLGSIHPQRNSQINLDEAASRLGLEPGGVYTLDVFHAERHTNQSNFRIDTTLELEEVPPTTVSPLYD